MQPLPEKSYVTMRLEYHPNTPADYEPSCFKASHELRFNRECESTGMGSVNSAYHAVDMKVHISRPDCRGKDQCENTTGSKDEGRLA